MRQLRSSAWLAFLLLAACNANPLLHDASADYQPLKVGQVWTYQQANGTAYVRSLTAELVYQGRQAFRLDETSNGAPASGSPRYWSFDGGDLLQWDPTLGWILYRRLPYVPGNSWSIPSSVPGDTIIASVDGTENVELNAYYANCFKIRETTYSYAGGVTSTAGQLIAWAAPGIGDVKYAQVDTSGTTTVLGGLTSYQAP